MASVFKDVDPLDIDDALLKLQESFNIRFVQQDLDELGTFGELTDLIIKKIAAGNEDSCTSQQAFYKLRAAVSQVQGLDIRQLHPARRLNELFPRRKRRFKIAQLESVIGFRVDILQPPLLLVIAIIITFIISFGFFVLENWLYGLAGMVVSAFALYMSRKTTKHFNVKTLGELAEKLKNEHYLKSRRNPDTINRNEIYPIVEQIFNENLGWENGILHKDANLV